MSKHQHKFHVNYDILGGSCNCGTSRFGTNQGMAEYNPKTGITKRVSDGKILYKPKTKANV